MVVMIVMMVVTKTGISVEREVCICLFRVLYYFKRSMRKANLTKPLTDRRRHIRP